MGKEKQLQGQLQLAETLARRKSELLPAMPWQWGFGTSLTSPTVLILSHSNPLVSATQHRLCTQTSTFSV